MIRDENYIVIHGFMRNKLNLKKSELQVYAIIYGFSQDGINWFTGSLKYICEWWDLSERTVITALQSLVKQGLIEKQDIEVATHLKLCKYRAVLSKIQGGTEKISEPMQKLQGGTEKISEGHCNNFSGGTEKISDNSIFKKPNYKPNHNKRAREKDKHYETFGFHAHEYDYEELEQQLLNY